MFLDRVRAAATRLELELAPGLQKVTIIVEQKAAAAAAAAAGEAKALANAVTPELEAEWAKLEAGIASHADVLAAIVQAHETPAPTASAAAAAPIL